MANLLRDVSISSKREFYTGLIPVTIIILFVVHAMSFIFLFFLFLLNSY